MIPAAEEIIEVFTEHDLHFRVQKLENSTRVKADVVVDYASFTVVYIANDEQTNDISVRVPHFVRFKEKDYHEILRVVNRVNARYRFCKFTASLPDEAVTIEYDFPENTENIGEAAFELFSRLLQIAEEVYPEFMKAIWTKQNDYSLGSIQFHDFEV